MAYKERTDFKYEAVAGRFGLVIKCRLKSKITLPGNLLLIDGPPSFPERERLVILIGVHYFKWDSLKVSIYFTDFKIPYLIIIIIEASKYANLPL